MKKRGFTLVELLAVLVLIAAISLVVFPSIINYINSTKGDISKATKELIISSTKLYVSDNAKTFPQHEGYSYCTTLETLADKNYIDKPFVDSSTGKELDLSNTYVKVSYVYDYDLGTTKYTYDVVDTCTAGIADNYELVTTSGSIANLDNKEVVDYKVYGNDTGISSLNLKTVGKNLVSNIVSRPTAYNVLTAKIEGGVKPGNKYSVLIKTKITGTDPTARKIGVYSDAGWGSNSNIISAGNGDWQIGFTTVTTSASLTHNSDNLDFFNTPNTGYADYNVTFDYVMIAEGSYDSSMMYEPYKELKEEVTLPSSLSSNDYIEYKTQTLVKSDGTMQKINLPKIKTYDGISNIIINDGTTNYPTKIELLVRNKNKA